jgi:hypothetical protein
MSSKLARAAFAVAMVSGVVAAPAAFAQSYGGGPTCGYGQGYDTVNQRCVSARETKRGDYASERRELHRIEHRLPNGKRSVEEGYNR